MRNRSKITLSAAQLDSLENEGLSEQQIAARLACSRMTLYKYRQKIGCPQKMRQGKGQSKYTKEEKMTLNARHQKNYRDRITATYGRERGRDRVEQRNIVLAALGRGLKANECLHHIDNDPSNNAHDNLVICTNDYHRAIFHTAQAESRIKGYKHI